MLLFSDKKQKRNWTRRKKFSSIWMFYKLIFDNVKTLWLSPPLVRFRMNDFLFWIAAQKSVIFVNRLRRFNEKELRLQPNMENIFNFRHIFEKIVGLLLCWEWVNGKRLFVKETIFPCFLLTNYWISTMIVCFFLVRRERENNCVAFWSRKTDRVRWICPFQ